MSWLSIIAEGILNEIGADDAYNRFYNKIPREDYDAILMGATNVDKFLTFILNCVRDGKSDTITAQQAVEKYNNSDPLVRQTILNNFKNDEYNTPEDILKDIAYIQNGGVVNRNKFAKEGYIKLGENDKWLVTATSNYEANNHYFGTTHWCTASDRDGNYDGYEQFQNYGLRDDAILVQFSNKNDEREKYQVQVYWPECNTGQICNFIDRAMSEEALEDKIDNPNIFNIIKNPDIIKRVFEIARKQAEPEKLYQEKKELLRQKKYEKMKAARRRIKERLQAEADRRNKEERDKIEKMWNEVVTSKKYEDPKFLSFIFNRDCTQGNYPETEEDADKTNHVVIALLSSYTDNGVIALNVGLNRGTNWFAVDVEDDGEIPDDTSDLKLEDQFLYECDDKFTAIVKINDGEITNILHIGRAKDSDRAPHIIEISDADYKNSKRFIGFCNFEGKDCVYDSEKDKFYPFEHTNYESTRILEGRNGIIYFCGPLYWLDNNRRAFKFLGKLDDKTGEYSFIDEPKEDYIAIGGRPHGIFIKKENRTIMGCLQNHSSYYPWFDIKLPPNSAENIQSIDYLTTGSDRLPYIEVRFNDNTVNLVSDEFQGHFIFGAKGRRIDVGKGPEGYDCPLLITDKGVIACVDFPYFAIRKYDGKEKWEDCDKYGRTLGDIERDKAIRQNGDKWNAEGGHSDQAKAEMEKMRDEYGGFDTYNGGDKAFAAWNDDDRKLDNPGGNNFKWNKNNKFTNALQNFDDNDNWRGYIGTRDPEGYQKQMTNAIGDVSKDSTRFMDMINGNIPDSVRRNPWYRIGKDGKPIDQPWYDEDEIPARLSDRVQKEQRLRESYNKMKTLLDKLS